MQKKHSRHLKTLCGSDHPLLLFTLHVLCTDLSLSLGVVLKGDQVGGLETLLTLPKCWTQWQPESRSLYLGTHNTDTPEAWLSPSFQAWCPKPETRDLRTTKD